VASPSVVLIVDGDVQMPDAWRYVEGARPEHLCNAQVLPRAFSTATGMPPHSYLINLRVERAKVALRVGSTPAKAALQVGFADQSHLTRHFKRLTGIAPGRFAAEASPLRNE
jgi:AraC-like DNA-binding protein